MGNNEGEPAKSFEGNFPYKNVSPYVPQFSPSEEKEKEENSSKQPEL